MKKKILYIIEIIKNTHTQERQTDTKERLNGEKKTLLYLYLCINQ